MTEAAAYEGMRGSGGQGKGKTYLGGSINLRLPCILALSKYSRRHNLIAVLPADQIRRLQEDSSTVMPRHVLPFFFRTQCTLNRLPSERGVGSVVRTEVVCVRGREGLLGEFPGLDLYGGIV